MRARSSLALLLLFYCSWITAPRSYSYASSGCELRPGLNSVTILPVTKITEKGSDKLVATVTSSLWRRMVSSGRFQIEGLSEFNQIIKRAIDEQQLQRELIDAYKQNPAVDTALPLVLKAGIPFVLVVSVQDYKEILPPQEAQPAPSTETKTEGKAEGQAAGEAAGQAPEAGGAPESATPSAAEPTPGESPKAEEKKPEDKKAKKPKAFGPRVEITLFAQLFALCADSGGAMQIYKGVVMTGAAQAKSVKNAPDLAELGEMAADDACRTVVKELLRTRRKRH